jgi:predicted enzyme related to lactoylglutathione lyase
LLSLVKALEKAFVFLNMRKYSLFFLGMAISFCFGFVVKTTMPNQSDSNTPKITGIGGVFFKCKDPKQLKEWYKLHLNMDVTPYGANFEWNSLEQPGKKGSTAWSPLNEKTKYFEPSAKDFMINYRVVGLKNLYPKLLADGVQVLDSISSDQYGLFLHVLDPEGNKIELWEDLN